MVSISFPWLYLEALAKLVIITSAKNNINVKVG